MAVSTVTDHGPITLSFAVDYHPTVTVVALGGEIDLATSPRLEHLVRGAVSREPTDLMPGDVIVDLSAVDFMGAAGLRLLHQIAAEADAASGTMFVRGATRHIGRLLEVAGVTFPAAELASDEATVGALVAEVEASAAAELIAAAMRAIAASAAALPSVDACSVTVLQDGQPSTVAASASWSHDLDEVQYEAGDGPCLAAARHGMPVGAEMVTAETRWPRFAQAAMSAGVTAVLSLPVDGSDGAAGALNLYSRSRGRPDASAADGIVSAASEILALAQRNAAGTTDRRLRHALESRRVISEAQGVLMHQESLSDAEAYWLLGARARERGTQLGDEAADVLRSMTRDTPDREIGAEDG